MKSIKPVHLYVRSSFSLLKSTLDILRMVELAKDHGYEALGLVDEGVMYAVPEFLHRCHQAKIKPIIGCELPFEFEDQISRVIVYARNLNGLSFLNQMSSLINTSSQSVSLDYLKSYSKDIVIMIPNLGGIFESLVLSSKDQEIIRIAKVFSETLDHVYYGLSYQEDRFWKSENTRISKLLKDHFIQSVAIPKVFYESSDDDQVYKVLRAIDKGWLISDPNLQTESYRYFLNPEEFSMMYTVEELESTVHVSNLIETFELPTDTYLPKFDCPNGLSSQNYLTQLCLSGLNKRFEDKHDLGLYKKRLKSELDVIFSMHYEDYFLIVWDFIRFAKSQAIYVGPGRGSAAGSLVAYVLGITHVDPIEHQLLFERFLNPERISMPDIDTDFPDDRRDEVLRYVLDKYGKDHVAHISTFGTLAAKQVMRDVGKVLELLPRELDALAKAIPTLPKMTLKLAYEQNLSFRQLLASDHRYTDVYEMALKLEGLPRHVSTHAAGIVLSSRKLSDVVPMIQVESDMASTQYTMEHLESLGLIKMDFLGLRNLSIIDEVVRYLHDHGYPDFNVLKLALDDPKTLELIRRVDTVGVFQLESEGMKNLLKQMQANHFDDIVATIALFRPGPMENIPIYLNARKNPTQIKYLHPDLEPILKSTYGIMIYQEQIMQVAQQMAGFSLAKADLLRKAMSKKNSVELEKMTEAFINGCIGKGYTKELATDLFALIMKFANYGFNKSHSVAYAMISYQMAYLKANHALVFYVALLNSVLGSESKMFEYLQEAKAKGIVIYPPDVTKSLAKVSIENHGMRLPLIMIKGLGQVAVNEILEENKMGEYQDFHACIVRLNQRKVNKNHYLALIDAGAMDTFRLSRASMKASLEDALKYADMLSPKQGSSFFDFDLIKPLPLIEVSDQYLERLENEKMVLGFYLSDHPISRLKKQLKMETRLSDIRIQSQTQLAFGMIKKIKTHRTKQGSMMAFVTIYDEQSDLDLVLMPNIYQSVVSLLKNQQFILVEGVSDKEKTLLVKKIKIIEQDLS